MRIAQVAPLWELVPPTTYGGTELVVHLLADALAARGHEVTLFAAKGSQTRAKLVPCAPMALRDMEEKFKVDKSHATVMAYELQMLGDVFNHAAEFDIIHNHLGFQALPFANFVKTPVVTTLHNALTAGSVYELYHRNAHLPFISISQYQQQLWPRLNYAGTIYHGIDLACFTPRLEKTPDVNLKSDAFSAAFNAEGENYQGEDYLVFLGRLSPEKGPQHAITVAKKLRMKLIMAGKIDRVDRIFYDREIAHWVDDRQIRYIGEVNHAQKVELLRHAAATLCPIGWPEPFGLVMIESMACGTPVFALRDGSVPEVIDHNRSGYIANSVEELITAVREYQRFDRRTVRAIAERRFSVNRMVDDHVALYAKLVDAAARRETASPLSSKATSEASRTTSRALGRPLSVGAQAEVLPVAQQASGFTIPATGPAELNGNLSERPAYPARTEAGSTSDEEVTLSKAYPGYYTNP